MTGQHEAHRQPTGFRPVPPALACLLIVGCAALAYHNSLGGALVFDDQSAIADNATIRHLWPLGPVLTPPDSAGVGGRPLANLTFALNYAVSGLHVWSYHLLNLALHTGAALALFGVVRRTLRRCADLPRLAAGADSIALAAAVLWAVHPVQTAAVDYLSQRTELLMGLCYLLTLYAFVRSTHCHLLNDKPLFFHEGEPGVCHLIDDKQVERREFVWQVVAVVACGFGMASKEVMVTAPLLLFLYDRTFGAGSFAAAWRQRRGFWLALGATWLGLAVLMLASPVAERGVGSSLGVTPLTYALTECRALVRYLQLAVWPSPLVFDYGWDFTTTWRAAAPFVVAAAGALAAVGLALWRWPRLGFAGVWFLGILAPTSTIIPIVHQPIAENRLYLPLAAVGVLLAMGLHRVFGRYALLACGTLAVAGGLATIQRNADYATEISLWSDTVVKRPANARAHANLAGALLRSGDATAALPHALAAARLRPDYGDAHTNAAAAFVRLDRTAEAMPHLATALRLAPDSAAAHYNLANAHLRLGHGPEAIAGLQAALRLEPAHAEAANDLCVALLLAGRVPEAIAAGEAALRARPGFADAHYNLGNALARASRSAEAIAQFEAALRHQPDFAKAEYNLGVVLLHGGRTAEAVTHFETALRLRPGYPEAQRALDAVRSAAPR